MLKRNKILASLAGLVVLLTLGYFYYDHQIDKQGVVFFDVGQGDSALIMLPNDFQVLIDAGPNRTVLDKLGECMPFYDRTVELVVLTHPHSDHVSGLTEVLQRYEVDRVMMTGVLHTSKVYEEFLRLIKEKEIEVLQPVNVNEIDFGDGNIMEVIYPKEDYWGKEVDNLNNNSIVFRLIGSDGRKYLFTGDIEEEVEELILENIEHDRLEADVLKVAHHGADSSSSEEFLKVVEPDVAIISVGQNSYGHPSLRIIKRLGRLGIEVERTDESGDIGFR